MAAASFFTSMLSMSSGLTLSSSANFSSLAFEKSKSLVLVSHTLPSTTMRGSLEPFIDDTPRSRIDVPLPRLPPATMSRPAIRPCRASSTVVMLRPSNSDMLIDCVEPEISSIGMLSPAPPARRCFVITTSSICVASSSTTSYFVLSKGSITVLQPTYVIRSLFLGFFSLNEKLPFMSVTVEDTIRLEPSISATLAIITGPNTSVTLPLMMSPAFCA